MEFWFLLQHKLELLNRERFVFFHKSSVNYFVLRHRRMKKLFLVGFMGSGKSTMGKQIAKGLNWRFIDLDDFIEAKMGKTITSIFNDEGEDVFRHLERETLEEMAHLDKVVVATGGGVPCFHDNMGFMNSHGRTVYLKLPPQELCQRLLPVRSTRPLIANKSDGELLDYIKEKLSEREPFYNQAHILADASASSVTPYLEILNAYMDSSKKDFDE